MCTAKFPPTPFFRFPLFFKHQIRLLLPTFNCRFFYRLFCLRRDDHFAPMNLCQCALCYDLFPQSNFSRITPKTDGRCYQVRQPHSQVPLQRRPTCARHTDQTSKSAEESEEFCPNCATIQLVVWGAVMQSCRQRRHAEKIERERERKIERERERQREK
jgi:hypothetical protein